MKQFIKNITPPFVYNLLKRILVKPQIFSPKWNTLSYEPLKGIQMFFDPSGPWQKKILDSTYDDFLFEAVEKVEPAGKIIFDIGAHIGFHTIYFARLVGPSGKVYAFEPNPKNFERLKLIQDKNNDIKNIISPVQVAVSDVLGTEEFNTIDDIESGRSSGGFIDTADTIRERSAYETMGFKKTKVKTVPMDLFSEELGIKDSPDIIKIDVEGAESLVLLGARKTIVDKKPILFMEIHSMLNMINVVSFLSSISYDLKILKEESDGRCFIEAKPKKR